MSLPYGKRHSLAITCSIFLWAIPSQPITSFIYGHPTPLMSPGPTEVMRDVFFQIPERVTEMKHEQS